MPNLIPEHTYDFQELWILIRKRNKWLINLRYFAFLFLLFFLIISKFLFKLEYTDGQFIVLSVLTFSIFVYNLLIYYVSNSEIVKDAPRGINPIVISLIQIQLDLIILGLIVYYTGGIESPFYIFYIFHMIIGSMILPGYAIYTIAGIIVVSFYLLSFGEYWGLITHHGIDGLFNSPIYNNLDYVLIFATAFGVMMVVSVFLANSITSALYRREQDLKITLDKLNNAEKIKQKYIMGVVHEIKSPIAAVQSYLDIILEKYAGPVSENVEDKLNKARHRSDEAIQIINDIIHISRLKLEGEIEKSEVDIFEVLNTVIMKREIQAKSKNINLTLIDKRNKKKNILGDSNLLDLAFSNLIGNSIKYTNEGGKIEIVLFDRDEYLEIEIYDNGIGIPNEDKKKIFSEFYRASNVKHKIHEGTGTGLSVVKQIIEQHGGGISFESPSRLADEKGRGTSFNVKL
ncbi:MAG: HAMP domain-containing sensor histidine kinase [Ignavibacteriae bacterium]|nr:HAMP domain-containing sensor histidine kinase [Ignavibacteriota bacterium]